MVWLFAGLALWIVIHLVPSAAPSLKSRLVGTLGTGPYKGLFALTVLLGLVLIVIGWRSSVPSFVYTPPAFGRGVAFPLMFVAILLFGASHAPTRIKRWIRHPQLAGLIVWSVAHLLANGDSRSLVLFGGLGLWALIEIPLLNRRDGAWVKAPPASLKSEIINVIVTVVIYALLITLHPYFAGVSPLPR